MNILRKEILRAKLSVLVNCTSWFFQSDQSNKESSKQPTRRCSKNCVRYLRYLYFNFLKNTCERVHFFSVVIRFNTAAFLKNNSDKKQSPKGIL